MAHAQTIAERRAIEVGGEEPDRSSPPSQTRILLNTLRRHPARVFARSIWLAAEFAWAAVDYVVHVARCPSQARHPARQHWLQRGCRRILRVFNIRLRHAGTIPREGLLVANHLSYLDILALGALAPATFVAKQEVRRWLVLGWFARLAGTVFVHRQKRRDAGRATDEIASALAGGRLVVLFAEGTSSDGQTVLPFKSALLAPAARSQRPLTVAFLRYALAEGSVADEVCYWRDMTLVPHLLNLLGKPGVSAAVAFSPVNDRATDRKALADQLHQEVVRLKAAASSAGNSPRVRISGRPRPTCSR